MKASPDCSSCFVSPSSATQRAPAASPSAHSISTSTPDRTRFPRGSSSRSTFHGEQLRDRRNATYNGPPASPSHETGTFAQTRRGTSTGIISKITSKFVRRLVPSIVHVSKYPEILNTRQCCYKYQVSPWLLMKTGDLVKKHYMIQ